MQTEKQQQKNDKVIKGKCCFSYLMNLMLAVEGSFGNGTFL